MTQDFYGRVKMICLCHSTNPQPLEKNVLKLDAQNNGLAHGLRWEKKKTLSCSGTATVHPYCVLDGRRSLGADAHDLLLSAQTCSFITTTLNHCFTQLEALMLLLTQRGEKKE